LKWFPQPQGATLYVGDQLTCERLAGLINILDQHEKFHQLNPAVADWHARLAFIQVCLFPLYLGVTGVHTNIHKQKVWKFLYGKTKTGTGSLKNIAGFLRVSNLPLDAKKDLNRVEDFLTTVTEAHVVAALREVRARHEGEIAALTPKQLANLLVDEVLDQFVETTFQESPQTRVSLIWFSKRIPRTECLCKNDTKTNRYHD